MKRNEMARGIYLVAPTTWIKKNELESEIEASNELDIGKVTSGDQKKWLWHPMENLNKLDPINKH